MGDNNNQNGNGHPVGGSGGPCVRPQGRADTKLIEMAVAEGWPIPDEYRPAIVERQFKIATNPESSPREATSAARCLQSMSGQNLTALLKLLDKESPDKHEVQVSRIEELLQEASDNDELATRRHRALLGNGLLPGPNGRNGHNGSMENGSTPGAD